MATRSINTKISLDGEKEFKQAISNINSGLGVLNSEMKKVTAEYKDNANSMEALKKKGDVLERTLSSQKDKVEELKKALQASAEQYGESDKRTLEWKKSLNLAETAVVQTEQAIKENEKAMQGNTATLKDLTDALGINLPKGAQDALSGIGSFSVESVAKLQQQPQR